jgi:phenylacetate-CoA ligase
LPVLTKEQIRQGAERMLAVPRAELDEVTTGGTSSMVPLTFYLDRDRSVKEWAFLTSLWGRIGYRPGDRLGVLGYRGVTHLAGAATRPWAWEPGTRELRLSPFRMVPAVMDEYLRLIEHYRVAYMYAYPSAISLLAAHARAKRWTPPRTLRGILLMSEALRPHQREVIDEGFSGLPVLCGYGLSEKVAIAGELPEHPDEYEFEPLYGYAELVDDEGRVIREPGRRGRLIGTGFISFGMPMIRYDTGDLATLVRSPSREDCWRLQVRDITSRHSQDYLVTGEGGLIAHTVVYPHNRVVRECQFVQEEPGRAVLRLVPEEGASREELEDIVRAVHARADGLLKVELEVVDEIPGTGRGKKLVVIQRLDLSGFGSP